MKYLLSFKMGACWLLCAMSAFADVGGYRVPLTGTGTDPDAFGRAAGSFKEKKTTLSISAYKLEKETEYQARVGGRIIASATTGKSGAFILNFESPDKKNRLRLDFEPRGQLIEILDTNGAAVLEGVFSGPGEPPKSSVNETVILDVIASTPKTKASARYTLSTAGVQSFRISLSKLPGTSPVNVLLNGRIIAQDFPVSRSGSATLNYRTEPVPRGQMLLDFDPRGGLVDVVQGGLVVASDEAKPRASGSSFAKRNAFRASLSPVGDAAGSATAKWSVDERARRKFSVELEDVDEGAYQLLVDGVLRGTIQALEGEDGVEGEIEFSNDDDLDELPLDFDPLEKVITIAQADTPLFEGTLSPPAPGASGPGPEPESELDEQMTSTGADADASGKASYEVDDKGRHRFKVEIEDVAVGSYKLVIGGSQRALIKAVEDDGTVEGEVEFRFPSERGKLPLNFDPRGQLIEILASDDTLLFTHLFGEGSGPAPGSGPVTPSVEFLELPLFAAEGAPGTILASWRAKSAAKSKFKLKARGLPVGEYDVFVGGVLRGTLQVVPDDGGTEGEIEFENPPGAGDLPLDFAVIGQEIIVSQGATVSHSRILTAP